MSFGIPYSDDETSLVIYLRNKKLVGQRLTDKFRRVYPNRGHKSILNKVQQLRNKKVIR